MVLPFVIFGDFGDFRSALGVILNGKFPNDTVIMIKINGYEEVGSTNVMAIESEDEDEDTDNNHNNVDKYDDEDDKYDDDDGEDDADCAVAPTQMMGYGASRKLANSPLHIIIIITIIITIIKTI